MFLGDGGQLFSIQSTISSEADNQTALSVEGDSFFAVVQSFIEADGANGIGIQTLRNGINTAVGQIVHTFIRSEGPGLRVDGGAYDVSHSAFHALSSAAVELRNEGEEPVARFRNSSFFHLATDTNANPAIVLFGTGGSTNAPMPSLLNCVLDVPGASNAIALAGGVTTGTVKMVGSALSTNLNPNVGLLPGVDLGSGNVRF